MSGGNQLSVVSILIVLSIKQSPDDMPPEKFLQSMIGYHLAYDNSLCGMVMTQGRQRQVINIGLGIKQISVEPKGVSVAAYAESFAHKVSLKTGAEHHGD